jgi:DNA-directed RNA polymerase alpha subunit
VPYTAEEYEKKFLMDTWNTGAAEKFMDDKGAKQEEQKETLAYFHRDIEKKEVSVACEECHSSNGILNFQELGFDKEKDEILRSIDIKGLVTKYKTFYMPSLFGD